MKLLSVAEMAAAEKDADAAGHSYEQMMELAGRGVAEAIQHRYNVNGLRVIVLVGPGNNGGDGLVTGRYLAQAGAKVVFYLYEAREQGDKNFAQIQEMGLDALVAEFDQQYRTLRLRLNGCDMVVDALLGTGVSRPITGEMAQLLRQVKSGLQERASLMAKELAHTQTIPTSLSFVSPNFEQLPTPAPRPVVVAVDCPSGLNCDTGEIDPLTIPADLTVTFAAPKRGHFLFPGASACGELVVADIGLDGQKNFILRETPMSVATRAEVRQWLPKRPLDGHKGSFGRVLIAAGSIQYRGAPILSARGAFRAGAGLVAVATPAVVKPSVVSQLPEATFPIISGSEALDNTSAITLLERIHDYKAILVGPGLSQLDDAEVFVMKLLTDLPQNAPPLILDADALNLLGRRGDWLHLLPPQVILTPHPGEMARLMDKPVEDVRKLNRLQLAQQKAVEWKCIVLLKGANTVVAAPDGRVVLIPFANPVLAVAGSGDVLGGVLVALLGQGVPLFEATILAAYLHGAAGQLASQTSGQIGLLASEIADFIPQAIQHLRLG